MRLFIALDLPPSLREAIARWFREIPFPPGTSMKRVRPEHMHLTLLFLGEHPENRLSRIQDLLQESVQGFQPLELETGPLGGFPHPRRARVVFLQIHERSHPPQLHALARTLRQRFETLGIRDAHAFHPHLTLARIRRGNMTLPELTPPTWQWSVQDVRLYQSTLTPEGPHYRVLQHLPLAS